MKVLLVNGSPHQKGCTYTALQEIADTLGKEGISTELFWLGNQPIAPCIACKQCRKTGECLRHDIVEEFHGRAEEADGFIFGTPVHYAAASGQLTTFLDRAFYSNSRVFIGKPGAAIVSCRRGGAAAAFDQLNKYFTINSMPIVSSQYWNMVHGTTPDEVRQDAEGLQTMRTLARNMAWLLHCIRAGRESGHPFPAHEAGVHTNFIR